MKEYEGLKFREIAEILGEPENTVKSRLYYGLSALKTTFNSWNINKEVFDYE
jgi:RNA polymerase sigma-70 factor (ECF subfamily)